MSIEIERRFLVISDSWQNSAGKGLRIRQGYILRDKHAGLRIRLTDNAAWLTLKGARAGIAREEFEYPIPLSEAEDMLDKLRIGHVIEKTRYSICFQERIWEVDVFGGRAAGLVLAEIELPTVDTVFDRPDWVGNEITGDPRFGNSAIADGQYAMSIPSE
ncbi:MAG: CYTH domain-containing protein [Pseudomonadota bacterium]